MNPKSNPVKLLALLQQAIALHNHGRLDEADSIYRQVLQQAPKHPDALHLRALVCHAKAQFAEAAKLAEAAIRSAPRIANLYNTAGEAWRCQGQLEKSRQHLNEAIRLDPSMAMAHHNLSLVFSAEARHHEARQCNRQALRLNPGYVDALIQGLEIACALDDESHASELLLRLGAFAKNDPVAAAMARYHVYRARSLLKQHRFAEADQAAAAAIAVSPAFWGGWALRGEAHFEQLKLTEAELFCTMAAHLAPENQDARLNLVTLLKDQKRVEEAQAHLDDWLVAHPEDANACFSLAGIALIRGEYAAGWANYEARWRLPSAQGLFTAAPQWQGQLVGRLFLYAEQGLGDSLQMLRFLPEVVERCPGGVVLQVQPPLVRLARRMFEGIGITVTAVWPTTRFDAACPLMSLPRVLGVNSPQRLLGQAPYLTANPARIAEFSTLLARQPGKKLGVIWRGSEGSRANRLRTLPEEALVPLLNMAGWTPVSLQFGVKSPEISGCPLLDLSQEIADFEDLAAAMMALDAVVSLDTGPAHLAGALGVSTSTLLPWLHDWRWGLAGERCAWYASMALFRQPLAGTWTAPIRQLVERFGAMPVLTAHVDGGGSNISPTIVDNYFPWVRVAGRYGTFTLPLFNQNFTRSMLAYGEYSPREAELLASYLRPGDTAVDVGANLGALTLAMAQAVTEGGRVLAFEPQSPLHHCLTQTLADSAVSWVQACCQALEMTRLDDLGLGACRLIKVDAQGLELVVLQGASRLIAQYRPVLYVQCERPDKRAALLAWFKGLGYRVFRHEPPLFSPGNFRVCSANLFPGVVSGNFLALPHGDNPPVDVTPV